MRSCPHEKTVRTTRVSPIPTFSLFTRHTHTHTVPPSVPRCTYLRRSVVRCRLGSRARVRSRVPSSPQYLGARTVISAASPGTGRTYFAYWRGVCRGARPVFGAQSSPSPPRPPEPYDYQTVRACGARRRRRRGRRWKPVWKRFAPPLGTPTRSPPPRVSPKMVNTIPECEGST